MLANHIDAVVMLTMSDWHTEMRGNRYHYATRFARQLPVIFVQPDLVFDRVSVEVVRGTNIRILHVGHIFGRAQTETINRALVDLGVRKPLLWIYNSNFLHLIAGSQAKLKVFHATEDFFCEDFSRDVKFQELTKLTLEYCDLLVSVSAGVEQSYLERGGFKNRSLVLTNGVDLADWSVSAPKDRSKRNLAVYQGSINKKIDFNLFNRLARALPHWEFEIYGAIQGHLDAGWGDLIGLPNVRYFGQLPITDLVKKVSAAKVGLVPFVQNDWILNRAFPLKIFEYLACGLHVVSTPIGQVSEFQRFINFGSNPDEIVAQFNKLENLGAALPDLQDILKKQDYDQRFEILQTNLCELLGLNLAPLNATSGNFELCLNNPGWKNRSKYIARRSVKSILSSISYAFFGDARRLETSLRARLNRI